MFTTKSSRLPSIVVLERTDVSADEAARIERAAEIRRDAALADAMRTVAAVNAAATVLRGWFAALTEGARHAAASLHRGTPRRNLYR